MENVEDSLGTIFVTCTFGEGEFPETMEKLWDYLEGCKEGNFESFRFGVFGLGSSMYALGDQFNRAAKVHIHLSLCRSHLLENASLSQFFDFDSAFINSASIRGLKRLVAIGCSKLVWVTISIPSCTGASCTYGLKPCYQNCSEKKEAELHCSIHRSHSSNSPLRQEPTDRLSVLCLQVTISSSWDPPSARLPRYAPLNV